MDNFQLQFNYWYLGATILIKNCTINNLDYLLKLPHYALKKPIKLIDNLLNSKGTDGLIYFFDDREFIKDTDSFMPATITLNNNIIELPNSKYIIEGLSENTQNIINIIEQNNTLSNNTLFLSINSSKLYVFNLKIVSPVYPVWYIHIKNKYKSSDSSLSLYAIFLMLLGSRTIFINFLLHLNYID